MGIREKLNDNPAITTGATAAIVIIAIAFIIWQLIPATATVTTQDFFSEDDGASYFKDDLKRVPPYDHNGKTAVRAHVFKCSSGTPFVGYVEKYSPEAKKIIESSQAPAVTNGSRMAMQMADQVQMIGRLVKRKGELKWHNARDPEYLKIIDVKCPDGSADIEVVSP